MSIFKEIPPTAGLPVYFKDLLLIFKKGISKNSLEEDFKKYLQVAYVQLTYSGTAAFYFILESLKELSDKKTVIIPSFICPLVPLAIKRSGLKVCVCDINNGNFNYNYSQLEAIIHENNDILAVLAVHLTGIPVDVTAIKQIINGRSIFLVEDCAQSLGALHKGRKVGSFGDFSFFSLCRGKGLTIYEGGVAVTNTREYAAILQRKIKELEEKKTLSEVLKIFELFGYWIFYRPALFWFIFRLPQLFWNLQGNKFRANIEYFKIDFPLHGVSLIRKLIGHAEFYRLDSEIEKQRQKAIYFLHGLKGIPGLKVIEEPDAARANYPYLTVIFDNPAKREKALRILEKSGLGVSQIYVVPITGYDYLSDVITYKFYPAAEYLAARHITLSTSIFMQKKDIDLICCKIREVC